MNFFTFKYESGCSIFSILCRAKKLQIEKFDESCGRLRIIALPCVRFSHKYFCPGTQLSEMRYFRVMTDTFSWVFCNNFDFFVKFQSQKQGFCLSCFGKVKSLLNLTTWSEFIPLLNCDSMVCVVFPQIFLSRESYLSNGVLWLVRWLFFVSKSQQMWIFLLSSMRGL